MHFIDKKTDCEAHCAVDRQIEARQTRIEESDRFLTQRWLS